MVTVDGGDGYWNPHPGDNPMAMVIDELIPRCQRLGLGRPPRRIGALGISMGGYGALLFAEKYPHLIAAVAAISPAIWTSYPQARQANPAAYASAAALPRARGHARRRARPPPGPGRGRLQRSLLPRRPGARPRSPGSRGQGRRGLGPGCHDNSSAPRKNRRRWLPGRSPPELAAVTGVLHLGFIAGTPGFLAESTCRLASAVTCSPGPAPRRSAGSTWSRARRRAVRPGW